MVKEEDSYLDCMSLGFFSTKEASENSDDLEIVLSSNVAKILLVFLSIFQSSYLLTKRVSLNRFLDEFVFEQSPQIPKIFVHL